MQDLIINENSIKDKIYTVRNMQVMLDRDLAELYCVETKRINEAVKNNKDKFMDDFYFELNDFEFEFLRSKISTTSFIITSPINNLNYSIILYGKNRCKKIITQRVV